MFISIYRNPKTQNWFWYETFIHLFEFKGSFDMRRERDTSAQSCLASPRSDSRLPRSEAETQLTAFSQIPKSSAYASGAWRHSHPLVSIPIWDFYFDISEWHILSARAWTPALMLHLTNPCTKRKVLILTKPKSKIYKTKSLRNYITPFHYDYSQARLLCLIQKRRFSRILPQYILIFWKHLWVNNTQQTTAQSAGGEAVEYTNCISVDGLYPPPMSLLDITSKSDGEFKSWTRLIAFHIALIPLGKVRIQLFSLQLWVNSRADWVFQPWWGN